MDAARAARAAGRTRLAEIIEKEARAREGYERDRDEDSAVGLGRAGGAAAEETSGSAGEPDAVSAPPRVRVLVDPSSNHPGARGSFYVDGAVPESILRRLERVGATAALERDADAAAVAVGRLKDLRAKPPAGAAERTRADTCADRAHFCDVEGWARRAIVAAARAGGMRAKGAHPQMRVLRYDTPGGIMAPHVDLSKIVHPQDVAWTSGDDEDEKKRRRGDVRDEDEDGDGDEPGSVSVSVSDGGSEVGSTHTFILYLATCASGGETALLADGRAPTGAEGAAGAKALADVRPVRGRLLVFPHDCPHAGRPVVDAPKLVVRGELW